VLLFHHALSQTPGFHAFAVAGSRICEMTRFDKSVLGYFGLPRTLPV
jgi:hypothetical protein